MAIHVQHQHLNGNGHMPLTQSKRAFQRSLPLRLGRVEGALNVQERRVDELVSRVATLEAQVRDQALAARADIFEGMIEFLQIGLGCKKRPSWRRPAVAR